MKICGMCRESKPESDFYTSGKRLHYLCKKCELISAAERRMRIKSTYRRKDKNYYARHRAEIIEKRRQYQFANKEKIAAHQAVKYALKRGYITKPPECEYEGCSASVEDAHHDDYSKQLDLKWLCKRHHRKVHPKQVPGERNNHGRVA